MSHNLSTTLQMLKCHLSKFIRNMKKTDQTFDPFWLGEKMSCEELPPELCSVIMSPISIGTIYSFTFIPSIMHWLEGLLVAFNLKKMLLDHCTQNGIPVSKVKPLLSVKNAYNYTMIIFYIDHPIHV